MRPDLLVRVKLCFVKWPPNIWIFFLTGFFFLHVDNDQCCVAIWFWNNQWFWFFKIFRIKELIPVFWGKKSECEVLVLQKNQNQRIDSNFLEKTESENHWFWLSQKHQRTGSFHERTNKDLMVRKAVFWEIFKWIENQGSISKPIFYFL